MAAITTTETTNLTPTEVLADCLTKTNALYLELLNSGFASDLYKEAGKTVRALAQSLSEASIAYDEDMDDLELEEEEQD
jgi:hypothetical protein